VRGVDLAPTLQRRPACGANHATFFSHNHVALSAVNKIQHRQLRDAIEAT